MAGFNIPLDYQSPQLQNGTDLLQRGLSIQSLATSNQIQQQRLQEEKLKAQQANEDLEDNNTIQKEFLNPAHLKASPGDPTHRVMDWDSLRGSLQGNIRLRNLQKLDSDHLQQVKTAQDIATTDRVNQTAQIQNLTAKNKLIGQEIQGLEQLSDADKPAYYAGSLQRLKAAGVDISSLPPTIPADGSMNQQLQAYAASAGYNGAILTDQLKKQNAERAASTARRQDALAQAATDKDAEATKQGQREAASRIFLASPPQSAEDLLARIDEIDQKYPLVAAEYDRLRFTDPADTLARAQGMAQTSQQRDVSTGRSQAEQDRTQYQSDSLDLRKQIAESNNQLRRDLAANKTPGAEKPMTKGQFMTEERNISAVENGTPSRPGLNAQRRQLGQMLTNGVDEKGTPFGQATDKNSKAVPADVTRARIQSQLDAVNDSLQQTQFRKAKLYGVEPPDTESIDTAKDGAPILASDGSIWKKSAGVAFYAGKGSPPPAAPPQSPGPTASAPPTSANQPAPGKSTAGTPGANESEQVTITLPNGKPYTFKNQAAAQEFADKHHLTIK